MAEMYLLQIPAIFAFSARLIKAPHFMASYHLAYSRGRGFKLSHWFQLIVVPIALGITLIVGDLMFTTTISGWQDFALQLNYWLAPLGIFIVIGSLQLPFDQFGLGAEPLLYRQHDLASSRHAGQRLADVSGRPQVMA